MSLTSPAPTDAGPLAGIRVVTVEQAVSAPFCTARLADAGAEVLKIERPEGDFARSYDTAASGESSYFVWLNRGKKSVVLDLALDSGRIVLGRLVGGADVFVQNLRPGAVARLGLAVEDLRARHPGLVCCSISGYGDTGPYAGRKAYDLLIQAECGLASVTGGPGSPARVGISIVDIATGVVAHAAVLEALLARTRTGNGADIRISMFDVMADWMTVPLLLAEAGAPPVRGQLAHPSIAPYGVFTTGDGRQILIAIQSDREWRALSAAFLGRPELADDARFATNVARVANRSETDALIADALRKWTRADAVAALDRAETAYADLNDMAALSLHPHLRRMNVPIPQGTVSLPMPAPIVDGRGVTPAAVPALGADTQSVLDAVERRETPNDLVV